MSATTDPSLAPARRILFCGERSIGFAWIGLSGSSAPNRSRIALLGTIKLAEKVLILVFFLGMWPCRTI